MMPAQPPNPVISNVTVSTQCLISEVGPRTRDRPRCPYCDIDGTLGDRPLLSGREGRTVLPLSRGAG